MNFETLNLVAQYLGVFAGYAGVVTCLLTFLVVSAYLAAWPLAALREKIERERRYDFLEMFDMDGEQIGEVVNKAAQAGFDYVFHQYRTDRSLRGLSSEERCLIEGGVKAALTHLERSMDKRRAQRKGERAPKSNITKAQLEINRKLVARRDAIKAREKELGIEVPWQLR